MIPNRFKIKSTVRFPTTMIIAGANPLGFEIAENLTEQGGYVIIVDAATQENLQLMEKFSEKTNVSFADYTSLAHIDNDLRRLDYVFFFNHESLDYTDTISTSEFLTFSNYLDTTLSLASDFEAKFLLTTSQKANQILFTESTYQTANLLSGNRPSVYTEMEVQRYSEGLVNEYHEKTNLDTRIIRLGELIGNTLDINKHTSFNKLLKNAVRGENLILENDGLDVEWLVHTSDAAYGLIKAMFSKKTTGAIYSVCYDNTFTHLAIAYKLQEVEEDAKEIRFVENEKSVPVLNTYKAAPNLSQIGWMPRIAFGKAISQSIAATKLQLMDQQNSGDLRQVSGKKNNSLDKFKAFIGLGAAATVVGGASAVQKSNVQKQQMQSTNTAIQARERKKRKTFGQKTKDFFWGIYSPIAKRFSFFRGRSPFAIATILFFITIFLLIFIFVISPLLVIFRDVSLLIPRYQNVVAATQEDIVLSNTDTLERIGNNLSSIDSALNQLKPFTDIFSMNSQRQALQNVINNYAFINSGYSDITSALIPFREYIDSYQNNLQARNTNDSFISIAGTGLDYSGFFDDMALKYPFLERGRTTINNAVAKLSNTSITSLPSFIQTRIDNVNQTLISQMEASESIDTLGDIPNVLGYREPMTHLIVILDNTRLTPLGGNISGFALLTMNKGSITEITVKEIQNSDFNFDSLTESDIESINLRSFATKDKENITVSDLAFVKDYEEFAGIARDVWESSFSREINGVMAVNLTGLQNLNSSLDSSFSISDQEFNSETELIDSINLLLSTNSTVNNRDRIITEIFSNLFLEIEEDLSDHFNELFDFFVEEIPSGNLQVSFEEVAIRRDIQESGINSEKFKEAEVFVDVGFTNNNERFVNANRFSTVNISAETGISEDLTTSNTALVRVPNDGIPNEVSVCLSLNTNINSIGVVNLPQARYKINTGDSERCIVASLVSETEVQIEWQSDPKLASSDSIPFQLAVQRVKGTLNSGLDYSIDVDESFDVVVVDNANLVSNENNVIFTTSLVNNESIDLLLSER